MEFLLFVMLLLIVSLMYLLFGMEVFAFLIFKMDHQNQCFLFLYLFMDFLVFILFGFRLVGLFFGFGFEIISTFGW